MAAARKGPRALWSLGGLALALLWPVLPGLSESLRFSLLGDSITAMNFAIVAISLVILTGWVGQISLAQASFVGLGAFATGIIVRSWHLPFPVSLPLAAGVSALITATLGIVALRVRGLYLAVATLIFAWMTDTYLFSQPWLVGSGGSSSIPSRPIGRPGTFPYLDFTNRKTFYYVSVIAVALVMLAAANLRQSRTGRAFFAVKGSEVAAASLGVDLVRTKLTAFAVSGFVAGIAGNLLMTHSLVATPISFGFTRSLFYLSVVVVGGLTSLGGALASGIAFGALNEVFYRVEALQGFLEVVSAFLLAGVLLFFPGGLSGISARLRPWVRRPGKRARSGRDVSEPERVSLRPLAGLAWIAGALLARAAGGTRTGAVARALRLDRAAAALSAKQESGGAAATSGSRGAGPRGAHHEPPDALERALAARRAASAPAPAPVPASAPEVPEGLQYVFGTATRPDLPPRAERPVVLSAENVTVRFGGLTAVDDARLEVREGEIVGLIGPNGAGKTTLFNAISGLNRPASGTIRLFGRDVTSLAVHERAGHGMGRTFQVIQLFPQLTVFDNLLVATHTRNHSGLLSHLVLTGKAVREERKARDRVREVVSLLGLKDLADRGVAGLPFGVLRLVETARALVGGAPFVMLDEPASGLDTVETERFMDLLFWVRQTLGVSIMVIEHDVKMVTSVSDYMYVIDRGRMIAEGTPAAIQRDPAVIAAYLGDKDDAAPAAAKGPAAASLAVARSHRSTISR